VVCVVVALITFPFGGAPVQAKYENKPLCNLQLSQNKPELKCLVSLAIKVGESENEITQRRERDKQIRSQQSLGRDGYEGVSVDNPRTDVERLYQVPGCYTGSLEPKCQCYTFAIERTRRYDLNGYGYARNVPINTNTPKEGAIMVTYESRAGHLAVVEKVNGKEITVIERNYIGGWVSRRTFKLGSIPIKGFNI